MFIPEPRVPQKLHSLPNRTPFFKTLLLRYRVDGKINGNTKFVQYQKSSLSYQKTSRIQIRNFYLLIPYSRGEHIKCVPKSSVK